MCRNDFPTKRKTLPEIAKIAGLDQEQYPSLSHKIPGKVKPEQVDLMRLKAKIYLILMKQEDKKKGKKDRLCKSAHLGKLGKIDNEL